jgi:hypothetical protein
MYYGASRIYVSSLGIKKMRLITLGKVEQLKLNQFEFHAPPFKDWESVPLEEKLKAAANSMQEIRRTKASMLYRKAFIIAGNNHIVKGDKNDVNMSRIMRFTNEYNSLSIIR